MTNFSIKKKNIIIILLSVLFSIVATIALLGIRNIGTFRNELETKIKSTAQAIGLNSMVAIEFNNRDDEKLILASLDAIPEVKGAIIYDKNDMEFVAYRKDKNVSFDFIAKLHQDIQYEGHNFYFTEKIDYNGEFLGTLYIITSTENLTRQIVSYLKFSLFLLIIIFIVAAFLGTRLSEKLTGPILKLAGTAALISSEGDYSIRVQKTGNDEIGTLYDSFNEMLEQIAARDLEIRKLNESLEDKVAERTRDLLIAKEQAENARQNAELADRAKSTFLANMSHEIRTPMNAILGYSNLLMKSITDKKQQEYLEIVQNSGRNLLALINDILDLSKIESGKLSLVYKPIDPHRIFSEIKHIFKIRTEEKGIDFVVEVEPDIPTGLLMDETRLRQILFNVVGNAVKFTHEGHIKLSVRKRNLDGDPDKICLVFKIKDTGIGIPNEQLEDIFKAFEQQRNQGGYYGGTGLGLAITRRLAEIMNGDISVESKLNEGSTFTIELRDIKINTQHLDAVPSLAPSSRDLIFDDVNILLVEDNLYNLNLVRAVLEEKNIKVIAAVDGKDALEKLYNCNPNLVLMDMKMQGMDGYEATQIIKGDEKLKKIPVIALTAAAMKEGRTKAKEAGCDGFLAKPLDEDQLFAELIKFLPYRISKKNGTDTGKKKILEKSGEIDLSHLSASTLAEIINILSTQITAQWQQLGNSMLLDEWLQFGARITALGERYDIVFLMDYGRYIIDNVEHLNIAELKKTIKKYPEVVEKLKGV
ncbi:MAG: ATP-binding protein [Acidobacteria bacterium]|nr:ATP-binding protein [Acidobacteriota bacterium]